MINFIIIIIIPICSNMASYNIILIRIAEQLLTDGNVNEQQLKCLPLKKAREDIGVSLLRNSGPHVCFWL